MTRFSRLFWLAIAFLILAVVFYILGSGAVSGITLDTVRIPVTLFIVLFVVSFLASLL
jgi:uncharacterized membrane protein YtjA (UPF0391 family)